MSRAMLPPQRDGGPGVAQVRCTVLMRIEVSRRKRVTHHILRLFPDMRDEVFTEGRKNRLDFNRLMARNRYLCRCGCTVSMMAKSRSTSTVSVASSPHGLTDLGLTSGKLTRKGDDSHLPRRQSTDSSSRREVFRVQFAPWGRVPDLRRYESAQ